MHTVWVWGVLAFFGGMAATAVLVQRVVTGNRIGEDKSHAGEDEYPGQRRSLHFIRQDVAGVLVGIMIANGLLATIAVTLILRNPAL